LTLGKEITARTEVCRRLHNKIVEAMIELDEELNKEEDSPLRPSELMLAIGSIIQESGRGSEDEVDE